MLHSTNSRRTRQDSHLLGVTKCWAIKHETPRKVQEREKKWLHKKKYSQELRSIRSCVLITQPSDPRNKNSKKWNYSTRIKIETTLPRLYNVHQECKLCNNIKMLSHTGVAKSHSLIPRICRKKEVSSSMIHLELLATCWGKNNKRGDYWESRASCSSEILIFGVQANGNDTEGNKASNNLYF